MILNDRGGKHLGWFSWDEAFRHADSIDHGIYAFYFGENKPNEFKNFVNKLNDIQ